MDDETLNMLIENKLVDISSELNKFNPSYESDDFSFICF